MTRNDPHRRPALQPYAIGATAEILYSWAFAAVALAGILLPLC